MRCREIERLVRDWSDGGEITAADSEAMERHILGCKRCGPAYSDILPFILRDARRISTVEAAAGDQTAQRRGLAGLTKRLVLISTIAAVIALSAILIAVLSFRARSLADVTFSLMAPEASSVRLVGDFEGWESEGFPMNDDDGDGIWTVVLTLKKGRTYRYNYLLNEERLIADPVSTLRVPDGFGGESSVLRIE